MSLVFAKGAHCTLGHEYGSYEADSAVATIIGATANVDPEKLWVWLEITL